MDVPSLHLNNREHKLDKLKFSLIEDIREFQMKELISDRGLVRLGDRKSVV